MQRAPGTLMANGHGEENFVDSLREWMPSIIAALALVTAWLASAVAWVIRDRRTFKGKLRLLRGDVDVLKRQVAQLEQMDDYPEQLTSERLHDVQLQAGKVGRAVDSAEQLLDRGARQKPAAIEESQVE